MNNESELSDAILYIDGEKIMSLDAITASVDTTSLEENASDLSKKFMLSNKEHSVTLKDVEFDYYNFKDMLVNPSQEYKLMMESRKYPRGNKLPRKKRIRNKWIKKYHKKFEFDNVNFE